MPNLINI